MVLPRVPANRKHLLHLIGRMVERRVSWPEIVFVVEKPQKIAPGHSGRVNCYRVVGRRRLRVTIERRGIVRTVAIAEDRGEHGTRKR